MTWLNHPDAELQMSAISPTEIAIKSALGKLSFSGNDIDAGLADLRVRILSYTAGHARALFDLPLHHVDPFDRQIIAQAMAEQIPVVTADDKFGYAGDSKSSGSH